MTYMICIDNTLPLFFHSNCNCLVNRLLTHKLSDLFSQIAKGITPEKARGGGIKLKGTV